MKAGDFALAYDQYGLAGRYAASADDYGLMDVLTGKVSGNETAYTYSVKAAEIAEKVLEETDDRSHRNFIQASIARYRMHAGKAAISMAYMDPRRRTESGLYNRWNSMGMVQLGEAREDILRLLHDGVDASWIRDKFIGKVDDLYRTTDKRSGRRWLSQELRDELVVPLLPKSAGAPTRKVEFSGGGRGS